MEFWSDWRYRIVNAADAALHVVLPNHEFGPLCNLERRMWWNRASGCEDPSLYRTLTTAEGRQA
jgi:hypothetical protein